jgi:RNA polymerase sigma factor (sigma-70 family)
VVVGGSGAVARRARGEDREQSGVTMQDVSDAELAGLASRGEQTAAGELLARRMPMLAAMARRITLPSIDADDLLAEAITHLLHKWADGDGPQDGIDAYVIRSMKNRVIDELRSPRSKTTTLELIAEPSDPEPVDFHRVELHREFALIRTALDRLPPDQRRVLLATIVDGRKPGDLVDELNRPASAIYALLHRAKLGLQRSVLQAILEESDDDVCTKCARHLPKTITPELFDDPSELSTRHIKECEKCSAGWQRYLLLMSCGGVACLVVVGALMVVPVAPASAAEPAESTSQTGPRRTVRPARLRIALGIAAVLAGAGLITWSLAGPLTARKPTATLTMSVVSPAAGLTNLTIGFDVDQAQWRIDDATFTLPADETLLTAPAGWSCRSTSPVDLACTVDGRNPRGGTLTFSSPATDDSTYRMVIHATTGTTPITGTAEGRFPR